MGHSGQSRRRICALLGASLLAGLVAPVCAQSLATPQPSPDGLKGAEDDVVVVTANRTNTDYRFGPGDKLRVTVYGQDDLSGEFQIDTAGYVRLALIGQIRASGTTARELETKIKAALDNGYLADARVAIEVTAYRPFYIIGQVGKPGQYPYVSNMSALDAIALAGGFTEKAAESTIYVRHEGDAEERAIEPDELTRIEPGDVVRVRKASFWAVIDVLSPLTGFAYVVAQATVP